MVNLSPLASGTLELLNQSSTATITTQLFKRGYRQQFLVGLRPMNPDVASFVGIAFTLRFIPSREDKDWDLGDLAKRGDDNLQWEAIESVSAGEVLMIDSCQDPRAASAGDMLLTRLLKRGAVGAVTDGAFRDGKEVARIGLPAYSRENTATTRPAFLRAVDMQVPIGCAGVAIYPGDVVVSDGNGVVVIPRGIADNLAVDAYEQEQREQYLHKKIEAGAPLWGTYPPNAETLAEYEHYRAEQGNKPRARQQGARNE